MAPWATRKGRLISELRSIKRFVSSEAHAPIALGILWFVAALATLLWAAGLDPLVFASPDESVVRLAAKIISEHGHPFITLPFPDPEDLAHPRSWVTLGDRAVPSYSPFSFYLFGNLLRLGRVGLVLVVLVPTSAIGAFTAGLARMLPIGRRWLALLAPGLAFPCVYWLLRPWLNMSTLLAFLCWAVFFWASWRRFGTIFWLSAAALSTGAAAAVRPDCAAFLLTGGLLLTLAARPSQWKGIGIAFVLAGGFALGINLCLNHVLTGHAFRAAYQIDVARQWGAEAAGTSSGFAMVNALIAPMGWPTPAIAAKVGLKYFFKMGPVAVLTFGQLALLPLLRGKSWLSIALFLASISCAVCFGYTHLHEGLFGYETPAAWAEHSVPRYLNPLYLLAAIPPILLLGRLPRGIASYLLQALVCVAAAAGLYEIGVREPSSVAFIHGQTQISTALLDWCSSAIPRDAMVYTSRFDKVLWSQWRLGTIAEPRPSAASVVRAVTAGLPVYVFEPRSRDRRFRAFVAELSSQRVSLVSLDRRRGLYRAKLSAR